MTASCTIKPERLQCVGGVLRNRRLVRGKPEGGLTIEFYLQQDSPDWGWRDDHFLSGGRDVFLMIQMF